MTFFNVFKKFASRPQPFGRYTDRSRRVMQFANAAAMQLKRTSIEVDHVFLGILAEGSGMGCAALKLMDVDFQALDRTLQRMPIAFDSPAARLPMAPECHVVIDHARFESESFGDDYVGTEHLLVSIAAARSSDAARALSELGASVTALRSAVLLVQANALISMCHFGRAVEKYTTALRFDEQQAAVNGDFAWLLATCEDPAIRDGQRAVRLAAVACEASGFARASFIDTLAAAHAEVGQFDEAIGYEERAIAIASAEHRQGCVERLQSYKHGIPWRELAEQARKR